MDNIHMKADKFSEGQCWGSAGAVRGTLAEHLITASLVISTCLTLQVVTIAEYSPCLFAHHSVAASLVAAAGACTALGIDMRQPCH